MERSEWELARQIDRKLRFITQQVGKLETHEKEILALKLAVDDMQEVFQEFKEILVLKKKIRQAFFWVVMVACTAGLTKLVDYQVSKALLNREDIQAPVKMPDTVGNNK